MVNVESRAIEFVSVGHDPLGDGTHDLIHLSIGTLAHGTSHSYLRQGPEPDMFCIRVRTLDRFGDLHIHITFLVFRVVEYCTAVAGLVCNQIC